MGKFYIGIMGGPLKPLNYDCAVMVPGGHFWSPMMSTDASLSNSYTPDRCCFSGLDTHHVAVGTNETKLMMKEAGVVLYSYTI